MGAWSKRPSPSRAKETWLALRGDGDEIRLVSVRWPAVVNQTHISNPLVVSRSQCATNLTIFSRGLWWRHGGEFILADRPTGGSYREKRQPLAVSQHRPSVVRPDRPEGRHAPPTVVQPGHYPTSGVRPRGWPSACPPFGLPGCPWYRELATPGSLELSGAAFRHQFRPGRTVRQSRMNRGESSKGARTSHCDPPAGLLPDEKATGMPLVIQGRPDPIPLIL